MNRIILIAALMISLTGRLFAQNEYNSWLEKKMKKSKTENMFNMDNEYANIRDFAQLRSGKMIVELDNVDDYNRLKNLDSILTKFLKDISFYKDSIDKYPGSVRIDYVIMDDHEFNEIRFQKHDPEGEIFVNKDGEISRLKIDQDTIRIVMRVHAKEGSRFVQGSYIKRGKTIYKAQYVIQITFCLNHYYDIDKIIADRYMLLHSIDTLQSTKSKRTIKNPIINESSTIYNPYANGAYRFRSYIGILKSESVPPMSLSSKKDKVGLVLNMGAGLIRNTITPMGEIGVSYYNKRGFTGEEYNTFATLSITPYFFFDRSADGQFFIKDNWFLNFDIGSAGEFQGIHTKLLTGGIGYLITAKGDYFKGTTMKAFVNIKLKAAFTVSPELIFTNNFKQIFPGITLKVF